VTKPEKRPVWDLPTRIFHWGIALSVFLSMLIVYGKKYLTIHIIFGILAFGLIVGRIMWGIVGTKYVRFSAFVKSISEAKQEFAILDSQAHSHSVGHPAIAGWVMLVLMFCALCVGVSGLWLWLFTDTVSKESASHIHEVFANTLLAIAFVHIQGVVLHIFLHRDGIVRGMIDGKRPAYEHEQIGKLGFWQKSVAFVWFFGSGAAALWTITVLRG